MNYCLSRAQQPSMETCFSKDSFRQILIKNHPRKPWWRAIPLLLTQIIRGSQWEIWFGTRRLWHSLATSCPSDWSQFYDDDFCHKIEVRPSTFTFSNLSWITLFHPGLSEKIMDNLEPCFTFRLRWLPKRIPAVKLEKPPFGYTESLSGAMIHRHWTGAY